MIRRLAGQPASSGKAHVSLLQFLFFAAYGTGISFFGLYYRAILTDASGNPDYSAVGAVLFLNLIIGILSPLVAGYLADKFKIQHRLISILALLVAFGACIIAIPGFVGVTAMSFPTRFTLSLVGASITGLFVRPIVPLIDTESLNVLQAQQMETTRYGEIRLFGSLGWVITAILGGLVLHKTQRLVFNVTGYAIGFLVLSLFGATGIKPRIGRVKIPWHHLRKDRKFMHFLVFTGIISLGMTGGYIYTGVFLADANVSYFVMGLAFSVSAVPEIPVLFSSRKLLALVGNRWMIIAGAGLQMLKFLFLYAIADTNSQVLFILVMLLQGTGYSLMFGGFINFMHRQAHKDLSTTYQSMYHIVFSLCGAFGTFMASRVTAAFSSRGLMGITGVIIGAALVYFALFVRGHPAGHSAGRPADNGATER